MNIKNIMHYTFIYRVLLCIHMIGCISIKTYSSNNEWLDGIERIVCIGNSLTAGGGGNGITYPNELYKKTGIQTLNQGIGGQTSTQIAARIGAIPIYVTLKNNQIPEQDSIFITNKNINVLYDSGYFSGEIYGNLCGIDGRIVTDKQGNWFFCRTEKGKTVNCCPNSIFYPKNDYKKSDLFIFWLGRNNYQEKDTVLSDIQSCVSFIQKFGCRFIVLSILNGDMTEEVYGGNNYEKIEELNKCIEQEFPDNYIDVRTPLINAYGISEEEYYKKKVTPASLRYDALHLNEKGYRLLAEIIASFLNENKIIDFNK